MTIKILFFILTSTLFSSILSNAKMKLYALCTPSHTILKDDYFLPSIQDDFEIIIEEMEQTCQSAEFLSEGWTQTTIRKVDLIIRAIKENWYEIFIFSDVDIQFFRPIQDVILVLMENNDLIIQKNNPSGVLCSGFFACRANEKTLQLWTDVKEYMQKNKCASDQKTLNHFIKRHSIHTPYNLTWNYLPDTFFGGGTLTGRLWKPGITLFIPSGIMMHHANYTKGIDNKIAQLIYVKNCVEQSKKIIH